MGLKNQAARDDTHAIDHPMWSIEAGEHPVTTTVATDDDASQRSGDAPPLAPFPSSTFIDALRAATQTSGVAAPTRPPSDHQPEAVVAPAPGARIQPSSDEWAGPEHNTMTVDAMVTANKSTPSPERVASIDPRSTSEGDDCGLTPAGWYPDPAGRFDVRYWNGHAWTEHVMTEEKPTVDAARPDGTDRLWLDAVVDLGLLRKSRVVVTNELIRFENRTVMLRDVSAISWSGMSGRGFVDARLSCTLWTADTKFRLEFAVARFERAQLARLRRAFYSISASVAHNVEPRLVEDRLATLERGEVVHVGPVALRTSGITLTRVGRKRHFGWGDVAVTERRDGVAVIGFGTGDEIVTLEVPTILRDAVLLPELIRACVTRFS